MAGELFCELYVKPVSVKIRKSHARLKYRNVKFLKIIILKNAIHPQQMLTGLKIELQRTKVVLSFVLCLGDGILKVNPVLCRHIKK